MVNTSQIPSHRPTRYTQKNRQKDLNILFGVLERKLSIEMQHQIDVTFLELYDKEKLIPRGLRINLQPTFHNDEEFTKEWNCILDDCSFKLMHLIFM